MPYPWHCPSSVVCVVSSNQSIADMKEIYSANVSHMPGLCLLDVDGAPHISYNIMPPKAYFHIFEFFFETTNRWRFILCQNKA